MSPPERLILAPPMLGIDQRTFDDDLAYAKDDGLAYAKDRKQFGRPIAQALQHRFADLTTDLQIARLMPGSQPGNLAGPPCRGAC